VLEKLLSLAAANAKLAIAAAAGAALVAGGSAVAIQNVASSGSETVTVADNASERGEESRSDTATAKINLPKPTKSPRADKDKADNHGRCVSEAAHLKPEGETGREHGERVSLVAKSDCGKDEATRSQRSADSDDNAAEAAEEAAEKAREAREDAAQDQREAAEEAAERRADAADTDDDASETDPDESGSGNGHRGRRP